MASREDDILRLLALGNTENANRTVRNDFGTTTQFPAGALAIPGTEPTPPVKEPGFLDSIKSFLPDSIQGAGFGSLVGLAAAPFIGPAGAILLGGGFGQLFGQEGKTNQRQLDVLDPQVGASLGLSENEFNVLRSLPADQRNAALRTLVSRKKAAPGAGNKVVGDALVGPRGKVLFKNPKPGKFEMGVSTNADGTRNFVNIADPATAARANASGASISKLTPPKQSNVLLTDNKGNIRSINKNDAQAVQSASELGFINTVGTKGAGGTASTKFFDTIIRDAEGNMVKEEVLNGDELNTKKNTLGSGETIEAVPIGKEKAFEKKREERRFGFAEDVNRIDNLAVTSQNILDVLRRAPAASTFAGGLAEKTSSIAAGIAGVANLAAKDIPDLELSKAQQGKLKTLAKDSSELSSATLELAFTIAELNGQTGRGLSDRDFQIALDIVGAGGDPAVVANTLGKLIKRLTKKTRNTAKNFGFDVSPEQQGVFDKVSAQADQFIGGSGGPPKTIRFGRDKSGRPVRLN